MPRKNGTKPARLSLTMVVRDCADTLRPLLKKMRPYVDEIILVLGGQSVDGTDRIARKYGDVVIPFKWTWDWSAARNEALKHVTGTWWMWLDGDDDIDGVEHLPALLDKLEREDWGRCDLTYLYRVDELGNVRSAHNRERILRTEINGKRWYWKGRVHELPYIDTNHHIGAAMEIVVKHRRDFLSNSSTRNLPIMLEEFNADPHSAEPRLIWHIGNAYFSLGKFDEAQHWFSTYLEQPENDVQQWGVNCMIARCCSVRHDWIGLESHAQVALGLFPQWKDPYILMGAALYHGRGDAEGAARWLDMAATAEEAPLVLFRLVEDYTINLWDLEHRVYAKLGRFEEALDRAQKGYVYLGGKEGIEDTPDAAKQWRCWVEFYQEAVRADRSCKAVGVVIDHLVRRGDLVRAKQLVSHNLPQSIYDDIRIKAISRRLDDLMIGITNPVEAYEVHDTDFHVWDLSDAPRVKWYIERLKTRGVETVLEVGCHNGDVSRVLAKAGFTVTAIDINEKVIAAARKLAEVEGLTIDFRTARLEDVKEQYDAVLFAEVLEHMHPTDQVKMLNYADRISKVVMGSVPAEFLAYNKGLWEHDDAHGELRGHVFEFRQEDLEALVLTDYERRLVNCHKVNAEDWVAGSIGFGNRVFEYDFEQPKGAGISFWLGEGFEGWTPESIDEQGLGGSETAAVRLAAELAARGHRVVVYANCEGVWDGVVYRHHSKFNPEDQRDVLVVSRAPELSRRRPNARMVVLWSHDVSYETGAGDLLTPELAANYDLFVVMSQWQRDYWLGHYDFIDPERIVAIGNAIKLYEVEEERQRHRFIWSSSADRGLDEVLAIWPYVMNEWPDAELHVFYGFNILNALGDQQKTAFRNKVMRQARQPGVFMHGRIGQRELAKQYAKSQFWLYPSMTDSGDDWHETFCIAAMEAQAYGCIPVTRPIAALKERIRDPRCFVEDWSTDSVVKRLLELDAAPVPYVHRTFEKWSQVADWWETTLFEQSEVLYPTHDGKLLSFDGKDVHEVPA